MRLLALIAATALLAACTDKIASHPKLAGTEYLRFHEGYWMVFFEPGESKVGRADAKVMIEAIGLVARDYDIRRWIVTGYCDTAETTDKCKTLGMRRAQTVVDKLAGYGLDRRFVELHSSPEDLFVPTGPGVSEQLNRRVKVEAY